MMKNKYIALSGIFILGTALQAFSIDTLRYNFDSVSLSLPENIESNFDSNLDSLSDLYYVEQSLENDTTQIFEVLENDTVIPEPNDDVYIERLSRIPTTVNLSYNSVVKRYIEVYTKTKSDRVEVMLGLSQYYFPIFDDIFESYNIPNEMKYMSIIESALNPRAYSRARAVGLWQFMYGTGKMYGLTINSYVDERMDPIKSTYAAARFVNDLYEIYHDWILVIAAYNCGPGNVNKAIRRAGGKKNYWDIYYYLPRETRGHVPAFIAATYIMTYYNEHNLTPVPIEMSTSIDTIMINDKLHLEQVAYVLNLPIKQLRDMNPQYKLDIIPGNEKPYTLILPAEKTLAFIDYQDSIFAYKDSVYFNPLKTTYSPQTYTASTYYYEPPSDKYSKLYYTVQSGDNLGYIASWYNVNVSDLKYWNNIYKNMIRSGQRLVVFVPKGKVSYYQPVNALSFAEKQKRVGITTTTSTASTTTGNTQTTFNTNLTSSSTTSTGGEYIYYTVQKGDTLWDIAKKYPGVTDTDLMRLNNLRVGDKIVPGQKLKVMKKAS